MLPLAGRTAAVTGASRGIGLAVARALAADGARVALVARGAEALAAAAAACEGPAGPAVDCPGDVADPAGADAVARRLREACGGAPDILVNNAGLFTMRPAHETDPAAFEAALATNLAGPFRLVRAFLAEWRARGDGHLVTIGSVADRTAFPGNAAYAAAKFGLRGLHEVLRLECAGSGVRTTLVSPGPVDTAAWDPFAGVSGLPPRAAMLRPEDVADAVRFAVGRPPHVNVDELRLGRT